MTWREHVLQVGPVVIRLAVEHVIGPGCALMQQHLKFPDAAHGVAVMTYCLSRQPSVIPVADHGTIARVTSGFWKRTICSPSGRQLGRLVGVTLRSRWETEEFRESVPEPRVGAQHDAFIRDALGTGWVWRRTAGDGCFERMGACTTRGLDGRRRLRSQSLRCTRRPTALACRMDPVNHRCARNAGGHCGAGPTSARYGATTSCPRSADLAMASDHGDRRLPGFPRQLSSGLHHGDVDL